MRSPAGPKPISDQIPTKNGRNFIRHRRPNSDRNRLDSDRNRSDFDLPALSAHGASESIFSRQSTTVWSDAESDRTAADCRSNYGRRRQPTVLTSQIPTDNRSRFGQTGLWPMLRKRSCGAFAWNKLLRRSIFPIYIYI